MPYIPASLVDQPISAIAKALADDIAAAEPRLRALTDAQASAPRAAGKWSRKQILGHLVDSAANNHQRFVRAQLVDSLTDPGYAQEHWVTVQRYADRPWSELIELWCVYNRHLVHVIAAIPESRRETPMLVGGDPPATLVFVALDYVGHIRHHLGQIFDRAL